MGTEKQTKTIGETTYVIETFGAKQGRSVLFRLFKLLGPALSEFASLEAGEDLENKIPQALRTFAATATEADFDGLCDAFAAKTKIQQMATMADGQHAIEIELSKNFDTHFANNYGEMIAWLAWGIQVNFASFLSGNGKGIAEMLGVKLPAKGKSASQSLRE